MTTQKGKADVIPLALLIMLMVLACFDTDADEFGWDRDTWQRDIDYRWQQEQRQRRQQDEMDNMRRELNDMRFRQLLEERYPSMYAPGTPSFDSLYR